MHLARIFFPFHPNALRRLLWVLSRRIVIRRLYPTPCLSYVVPRRIVVRGTQRFLPDRYHLFMVHVKGLETVLSSFVSREVNPMTPVISPRIAVPPKHMSVPRAGLSSQRMSFHDESGVRGTSPFCSWTTDCLRGPLNLGGNV